MRNILLFFLCLLMAFQLYSQNSTRPASSTQIKFITTEQVLQDIKQNGKASKYYETSQDLIFLDENLIGALNAITPGIVTPENIDYIKYINGRDQKPYREVWDHNVYMKYTSVLTDINQLLANPDALADLKKRLGREFYRLDASIFTNGTDRIMFILRSPGSEAGSFYRAFLTNGWVRIDEISNWRDS